MLASPYEMALPNQRITSFRRRHVSLIVVPLYRRYLHAHWECVTTKNRLHDLDVIGTTLPSSDVVKTSFATVFEGYSL